jgi:hypothetical protein
MIEWNPHIINEINNGAVEKLCEEEQEKSTLFLNKYKRAGELTAKAQDTLKSVPANRTPLAYRLEPRLSDITDFNNDVLLSPKFGGIPDMTWWYSFVIDHGKMEGKETQKLDENIKEHWPVCGCCHKPLWFLGQVNMTDWARVIHLLTYEDIAKEEYQKNNRHFYQLSGLGSGDKVGLNLLSHDLWWYFFYCDCFNYNIESSSAVVLLRYKFKGFKDVPDFLVKELEKKDLSDKEKIQLESLKKMLDPKEKEKCLWPIEDYCKAVEKFMEENKIHPEKIKPDDGTCGKIPLQFINGFDLRFDIDYPGVIHEDLYETLYYGDNKPEKDIFGSSGPYSLFGRPHSQQEEPRYVCSYGYDNSFDGWKIHRMAPIICWNDSEHDMTRQMYGCFRCVDSQSNTVWAKMDHSCT